MDQQSRPDTAELRRPAERLTTSESLALDVVRISAAAMVAAGHLTQPTFSTGWPDLTFLARTAVGVFFVLSGFVIRHVTIVRNGTLESYARDRASRIYSVAAPALLVTLIADTISRHWNPGFYSTWIATADHPIRRILENFFFTAQLWNHIEDPLSNLPFWSLNYEVMYYALYGFAFYLEGWKRYLLLAITMLAVGPLVLALAPLWVAGCIAHDLYQKWNACGKTARNLDWAMALSLAAAACALLAIHLMGGLKKVFGGISLARHHLHIGMKPGEYLFGLFGTLLFLRLLVIVRPKKLRADGKVVRAIRFISEGTFPLYLLHFPLLVLIGAFIPYNHASAFHKMLIFAFIFSVGVLAGHPCNQLKMRLRSIRLWKANPKSSETVRL